MDLTTVTRAHLVGIKGTGMCALAELLHRRGVAVTGSDTGDVFYTDAILKELGIPFEETFDAAHVAGLEADALVVHSAAYDPAVNPELVEARRRGLVVVSYPGALGAYSALFDSSGIAGVHGKTTTTALAGCLVRGAGLPAQVLAGSAVSGFGSGAGDARSTLIQGEAGDTKYFIAETCEYRRHFLAFHPRRIVLTSVESDHQDYYPDYGSIRDAFIEYCLRLPPGGGLIYCADDPGATDVAARVAAARGDVRLTPYGFTAEGRYGITSYEAREGRVAFTLRGAPGVWRLRVPGRHTALNAAAALALVAALSEEHAGGAPFPRLAAALEEFRGSKRRSEILGEAGGVLFMDDYAHHPTAIRTTLAGLREFYPRRRLVVSFMSHTYTRTAALLDEFAAAFEAADVVCLHKIYASAREVYHGGVTGRTLFDKVRALRGAGAGDGAEEKIFYVEEPEDAAGLFETGPAGLRPGDLFITLGAGDNWKLGRRLLRLLRERREA